MDVEQTERVSALIEGSPSTRDPQDDGTVPVAAGIRVSVVPLDSLTPLSDNPRAHTTRGQTFLEKSLGHVGAARSGVVDDRGTILAGNGLHDAATHTGFREAIVIESDGTRPVFVKRSGLSEEQKARVVIDDNRAHELTGWNPHLRDYAERFPSIKLGWTAPEWRTALASASPSLRGHGDPDAVPSPRASDVSPGDLFALGSHRLLCGDATNPEDVRRLLGNAVPPVMATDPPWGVGYEPAWRAAVDGSAAHRMDPVPNDHRVDWSAAYQLFPGDVVYVWHASLHTVPVAASIEASGFALRSLIVWTKQHFALSRGDYHQQFEPCWYAVRAGQPSRWQGDRTQSTVWSVANANPFGGTTDAENAPTPHATQKPVAVFEPPVRNHTEPGDAIYDPFCGSGTSIIAAEKWDRACYALELTPAYAQVIIDRWEAFTGERAVKLAGR